MKSTSITRTMRLYPEYRNSNLLKLFHLTSVINGAGEGQSITYYAYDGALLKEYGYRNGQLLTVWDGGETGDKHLPDTKGRSTAGPE